MIAAPAPWITRKTISQVSAAPDSGVAPQSAEAVAKIPMPIMTIRRWPAMSAIRPPKANSAASASMYPLITHWTPVSERLRSFCRTGVAIETIVWSMNVIDTAKIIAMSARRLFVPELI